MKFRNLLAELRLSRVAREELDQVLAIPEVEQIIGREEEQELAERAELVKHMTNLPGKFENRIQEAVEAAKMATRRHEAAEKELVAARQAMFAAQAAAAALDREQNAERFEIERQLVEGADSRLDEFIHHLGRAESFIGASFQVTSIYTEKSWLTGERNTVTETNLEAIQTARVLLNDAIRDCEAMRLEAISSVDVAERLTAWFHKLCPVVEQFKVHLPYIDAAGHVVIENPKRSFREHLQDLSIEPGTTPAERNFRTRRDELRRIAARGIGG